MCPNVNSYPPVYLQSGDPEGENVVSLQAPGTLGLRFTKDVSGAVKGYQLVKTDSSMSVNPYSGAVAWWSDQAAYLVTTSPTTLGRGRVAGVFRNAITPGRYGCIQWKGICTNVKLVDAPTASPSIAGLFVTPSATAGKADVLAAGSAATYPPLGRTAGTLNLSDNTCSVDLDVPETF